ncbi:MAG TPA: hypothetical protein VFC68_03375, partial [Treponemataceae bacterium]|nr:hypothetical protein [Treponemataceae bacterium]
MKTVLRQEWNASKKRIVTVSVVLAGIMTFCIFINVLTYYLNTKHVFGFGILLYILCFFIGTSGVVLFSLIKGSGNLHSVLFKETNYLMLTIPKRSWVLMGGKILMNLFEFIIYAIPTAFYLSFLGPVGEFFIQKIVLNGKTVNEGFTIAHSYWGNVKQLYHAVFVTGLGHTIQVIVFVVSMFVVVQIFLNMAFAIYAAFIKLKKKHFILMAIII